LIIQLLFGEKQLYGNISITNAWEHDGFYCNEVALTFRQIKQLLRNFSFPDSFLGIPLSGFAPCPDFPQLPLSKSKSNKVFGYLVKATVFLIFFSSRSKKAFLQIVLLKENVK